MPGFEQSQNQRQLQQQTVVLSARQQLGLELLAMSQLTLNETIQHEISVNPVLEENPPENFSADLQEESGSGTTADNDDYEDGFEAVLARQESWINKLPLPESDEDRKLAFLSNSPAPGPSLRDLLLNEAENADIPENLKLPLFEIISSLDPNGFLTVPLVDLVMSCSLSAPENADVDIDDLEAALKLLRTLAPPDIWIGRRSDFFKQQLENAGKLTPEFSMLCDELEQLPDDVTGDDLKKKFLPELSVKLNLSPVELENMLAVIQEFKVNQPAGGESAETVVIYPDLEITELADGKLVVNVLYENSRRITLSPVYENMLENKFLSPDDKKYLTEKFSRAKNFIQALAMRESTLKRIGELIVDRQRDFFRDGVPALKSFTMSEAAELLKVNPSTVTRAVDEKYVRTPAGVLPLRFFFPGGGGKSGSGELSREAVMAEIKKIIDHENPAVPFSDDRITEMLKSQGMTIERRTVAKYRTILNIPGASKRKNFKY